MANETPGTRLRVENRRDGGGADGGEFAAWRCGRAAAFCRESVSGQSAAAGTRRDLAILVHHASGKTFTRNVVEEAAAWTVRSHVRTTAGWKNCRLGVATCHGTAGMNGSVSQSSNHRLH